MKKLLVVLFIFSVVFYANTSNETALKKVQEPITTYDLPYVN